jgi:DNA invertase Pin-like site-specific DNA recombinase
VDEGCHTISKKQLQMMGAFAKFERNIIRKRQAEGIAKAKERGVYSGRAINDRKIVELKQKGYGATEIASEMGITSTSVIPHSSTTPLSISGYYINLVIESSITTET